MMIHPAIGFTHPPVLTHYSSKYGSDSDDSDTETPSLDVEKLPPLEIGPGEHKLQYSYCLWYHRGSMTKFKSPMVRVNANGPAVIVEPMIFSYQNQNLCYKMQPKILTRDVRWGHILHELRVCVVFV